MSRARLAAVAVAAAWTTASPLVCLAQEEGPVHDHQRANESFFGWTTALIVLVPLVLMVVLARSRAKSRPSELPAFDDENFEAEVLESRVPVLVHFARQWNVANAAAVAQTELLAYMNRGAVKVGVLEIDACPQVMARLPGLEPPAYLLFYQGRKLFHRPGLQQAESLQTQIDAALSREGF